MLNNKGKALELIAISLLLTACGGTNMEEANSTVDVPDADVSEETDVSEADSGVPDNVSEEEASESEYDIMIDQVEFTVGEEIDDGERDVFMQLINNSDYTISEFEITFSQKSDITKEQKEEFYADLQSKYELSDEDMETLKELGIAMYSKTKKVTPSGEKKGKNHLYYYSGYYYMRNLDHFDLVEPDIATIKYVKDEKIYTEYYDYRSGNYSLDDDEEDAFEWGSASPLADMITKPDVEICKVDFDRDDLFKYEAFGYTLDECKAYIEDCKAKGFTIDESTSDYYRYSFDAENDEGIQIEVEYDSEKESIIVRLSTP